MKASNMTAQSGPFDDEEPTEPDGYTSTPEASALYAAILDTEAKVSELHRALDEGFALDVEIAARTLATVWHDALGALTATLAHGDTAASSTVSVALVALKISRRLTAELFRRARSVGPATRHPRLYDTLCSLGDELEAEFTEAMTFVDNPYPANHAEGTHVAKETMRS
jgi:hypothetical protein